MSISVNVLGVTDLSFQHPRDSYWLPIVSQWFKECWYWKKEIANNLSKNKLWLNYLPRFVGLLTTLKCFKWNPSNVRLLKAEIFNVDKKMQCKITTHGNTSFGPITLRKQESFKTLMLIFSIYQLYSSLYNL